MVFHPISILEKEAVLEACPSSGPLRGLHHRHRPGGRDRQLCGPTPWACPATPSEDQLSGQQQACHAPGLRSGEATLPPQYGQPARGESRRKKPGILSIPSSSSPKDQQFPWSRAITRTGDLSGRAGGNGWRKALAVSFEKQAVVGGDTPRGGSTVWSAPAREGITICWPSPANTTPPARPHFHREPAISSRRPEPLYRAKVRRVVFHALDSPGHHRLASATPS